MKGQGARRCKVPQSAAARADVMAESNQGGLTPNVTPDGLSGVDDLTANRMIRG